MTDIAARPGSWQELLSGGNLARLFLVCFGVWLHAADSLVVATMTPAIVADIGGARLVAWMVVLYQVGSIAAGASGAILSRRYGLKAAMSVAALTYMAGCAVSGLAPAMWVMLLGRLAQGLGGGGLVAMSFVAVTRLFPRTAMPRALAALSALWGTSAFVGPLVGGLFADAGVWRGGFWLFAAQAIVLAGVISLSRSLPPRKGGETQGGFPVWRIIVLSLGVVAVAAAGIEVAPARTALLITAGLFLIGLFLHLDSRREGSRLLPVRAVDPRTGVGAGLLIVLCFSAATIGFTVYGPLLIIRLHDVRALTAGYLVASSSIGWSVMSILVSGFGEKRDGMMIQGGMIVLTASILGFMLAVPYGPVWAVLLLAVLEGIGFGMSWTFTLRRMTLLAPESDAERAASAMPTLQQLGYAIGAAYVGIVANAAGIADRFAPATARNVGFWIFAACLPLAAVGLYAAWCFVRFGEARKG